MSQANSPIFLLDYMTLCLQAVVSELSFFSQVFLFSLELPLAYFCFQSQSSLLGMATKYSFECVPFLVSFLGFSFLLLPVLFVHIRCLHCDIRQWSLETPPPPIGLL